MENSCPTPRFQIYSKLLKMNEKLLFHFQIFASYLFIICLNVLWVNNFLYWFSLGNIIQIKLTFIVFYVFFSLDSFNLSVLCLKSKAVKEFMVFRFTRRGKFENLNLIEKQKFLSATSSWVSWSFERRYIIDAATKYISIKLSFVRW